MPILNIRRAGKKRILARRASSSPRVWELTSDSNNCWRTLGRNDQWRTCSKRFFCVPSESANQSTHNVSFDPTSTWSSKLPPISWLKIGLELPNLAIKKWATGYQKWRRPKKKGGHWTVQTIKQGGMATKSAPRDCSNDQTVQHLEEHWKFFYLLLKTIFCNAQN